MLLHPMKKTAKNLALPQTPLEEKRAEDQRICRFGDLLASAKSPHLV